ncbi:MAG: DUF2155 domain-containing protein [Hyphomicrobiaceae bacterium]
MIRRTVMFAGLAMVCLAFGMTAASDPAVAKRLENKQAVFAALDKVTARISRLEINLDETSKFGALKITPRVCYSRPPTEPPKTTAFVEVTEIKLDGTEQVIFSGWMFAQSPGLNAVEHPVFDVWLTDCGGTAHKLVSQDADAQPKPKQRKKRRRKKRRR